MTFQEPAISSRPQREFRFTQFRRNSQSPTSDHTLTHLNPLKNKKNQASAFVSTQTINGNEFLNVKPEALRLLSAQAMTDIAHLLRPAHLKQLSNILKDPEATSNDKFVALELLKNANIASNFVLPGCQDTGTAIISGKRGQFVLTDGDDETHLSHGVYDTYTATNLRYSQVAPLDLYKEVNTKTNLPAQIDLYATKGNKYEFLFIAKGGGSANKTYLYQQTKALLNPSSLMKFLEDNIKVRLFLFLNSLFPTYSSKHSFFFRIANTLKINKYIYIYIYIVT